jgi:acetyl/propionyl-CoA carboxylase alpha subunit
MRRALEELVVVGIGTNQGFHTRLFADTAFVQGDVDIQFLDRRPDLAGRSPDPERSLPLAVAAALLEDERRHGLRRPVADGGTGARAWVLAGRREALR